MMKRVFVWLFVSFFITSYSWGQNAWINEFHYDNTGADVGEFVEVVIETPGSYTLSLFEVVLYNGKFSQRVQYDTKTIDNFIVGNTVGYFTF